MLTKTPVDIKSYKSSDHDSSEHCRDFLTSNVFRQSLSERVLKCLQLSPPLSSMISTLQSLEFYTSQKFPSEVSAVSEKITV